jgi:hypothetical protein
VERQFRLDFFNDITTVPCGPGSVVGIATAYGLDGPGIESVCFQQRCRKVVSEYAEQADWSSVYYTSVLP